MGAMKTIAMGFAIGILLATGCVSTGTFDKKVAELQQITADHDMIAAEREKAAAEREKVLEAKIAELEKKGADLDTKVKATIAERDTLQKSLDDTTALTGELKKRLEKLGQNVEKLSSEKGELARTLDDAKGRLEELRKQKLAAEARAATFRSLMEKLRSMIDAGQLKVIIRDGRMIIALESDVLFDSGKTGLKPAGQTALTKVAQVLATITDRKYQVAGHTDNVPIHTAKFPSNWELSTARAVEVVNFLVASGMKPQQLSAAGFGEFDPVAANDTADHQAQNRRIEIVLLPNLSELPSLADIQPPAVK
jgi:chemotaxis protein MotB